MLIYPAIDLLGGNVVRLYQGDYGKQETFGDNPVEFAKKFADDGAAYLHLVDLDGAKAGTPHHFGTVADIVKATRMFIELGGGIRDEKTAERCFASGVGRVILGTTALQNPSLTKRMVQEHGDGIAVAVDARDGRVAIEGWLSTSDTPALEFCSQMREIGVKHIIYTDIARDGVGKGIDLDLFRTLAQIEGLEISASGGITTLDEIAALRDMGLYGAVLGKALYKGDIDLKEAIKVAEGQIG